MTKDKDIFSSLNDCKTKQILVVDYRSLGVIGFKIVQVDNDHFIDVFFVPSISYNLLLVY